MTGGGLMQLVAYGAQDVYLTGNPQITLTYWRGWKSSRGVQIRNKYSGKSVRGSNM